MPESEVARLLQQIAAEYEAGCNGLTGLAAGTARHTFITARMEKMQHHHAALIRLVGKDTAIRLLDQHLM